MPVPADPKTLRGATSTSAGAGGEVPQPLINQHLTALRGDGNFRHLNQVTNTAASPYAVTANDEVIFITGSGARSVTIAAAQAWPGRELIIKDAAGNAGTGTITITPNANVDGAATITITSNYGVRRIVYNGTVWFSI